MLMQSLVTSSAGGSKISQYNQQQQDYSYPITLGKTSAARGSLGKESLRIQAPSEVVQRPLGTANPASTKTSSAGTTAIDFFLKQSSIPTAKPSQQPKAHARYNSTSVNQAPVRNASPTNGSSIRAATIDINAVNLNINELYKQYAKKPGTNLGGSSNFNNTTQVHSLYTAGASKQPQPPLNYRAISMLEHQSSQLSGGGAGNFLNTTQVLTNRHSSIGGGGPQLVPTNRKSSPGKSPNSNYYETCSPAAAAERDDDQHAGVPERNRQGAPSRPALTSKHDEIKATLAPLLVSASVQIL